MYRLQTNFIALHDFFSLVIFRFVCFDSDSCLHNLSLALGLSYVHGFYSVTYFMHINQCNPLPACRSLYCLFFFIIIIFVYPKLYNLLMLFIHSPPIFLFSVQSFNLNVSKKNSSAAFVFNIKNHFDCV